MLKNKIKKFGFVGHPISLNHMYRLLGLWGLFARKLPPYNFKNLLLMMPPFKHHKFKIKSITGAEALGYSIILPLLPEQVAFLGEEKALARVMSAGKLAERIGVNVLGLGGITSVVGNEGEYVSKNLRLPVTSGNTYPSYLSICAIEKACKIMDVEIDQSTACVIGATGDIGSICTKLLAKKVKRVYIVARKINPIKKFAQSIKRYAKAEIIIPDNMTEAIKCSDIVLTATTAITSIIEPKDLKPGAIVCDVAVPANVTKEVVQVRNDVLVFEGGLAKLPHIENKTDKKFNEAMLDMNCVYGCLAETMLLALDNRLESFTIGRGNISENKVNEIGEIANKHGFELSDFFCGYKKFTESDLKKIKENAIKKRNAES